MKTYIYKIKPNTKIVRDFEQWAGVCRLVYNMGKEIYENSYSKNIKISFNEIKCQLPELRSEFNYIKEVHSQTLQASVERLEKAYKAFFRKISGYPKWASKKRFQSIQFKSIKQLTNGNFKLPKFGIVKVFNKNIINHKLITASIVRKADGLYLHVVVEKDSNINKHDNQVGIDVGIQYLYVSSAEDYIDNPRHFKQYEARLRVENRKLSKKKKGSSNWYKQIRRLKLLYLKLNRVKMDHLHKESTKLAIENKTVFCENLNINSMIKNRNLSKHISDVSWGTFLSLISYKTDLVKVDSKYTSQACSVCEHIEKGNRLTQSGFKCLNCGHSENADYNASKNILKRGQTLMYANVNQ